MFSAATKASAEITKDLAEHDLKEAVHDASDEGRERLHQISDYANRAGEKVRGAVDRTLVKTGKLGDRLEDEIKANPIRSAALALGAGILVGAILARR